MKKKKPLNKCTTPGCNKIARHGHKSGICHSCYKRKRPYSTAYDNLKGHSKARGIAFDLTKMEFIELCKETGYLEGTGREGDSLTLDRIDSRLGYSIDNLQILSRSENSSKYWQSDCWLEPLKAPF